MNMRWWKTYSVLSQMKKRLIWSQKEISEYRNHKLRNLIAIAYDKSPFYHTFYNTHGIHPDTIKTIHDLKRLPVLRKNHLLEADPMQVVTIGDTSNALESDWMEEVTSGSTGHPLRVFRTWRDLYYIKAKIIRAYVQTGYRLSHRQVVLKSSTASLTGTHWFEKFGILRKYWLSITDAPETNLKKMQDIQPQHLHGYPSGLVALAEFLQAHNQTFHIPVICAGAEVLDQASRQLIEKAFDAEVFDLYGTREVGNIAWECKAHAGLHINDDVMIVELLDENGEEVSVGEEGEVVVTYLDAVEYPFIRYALEDRAVRLPQETCSCGVTFSKLDVITGRSDSRILLPSGTWVSGMVFQELRTIPWLSSFRIIQDNRESVRLYVVPKYSVEQDRLHALAAQASALMNDELTVIPEVVDRLEREKSGKLRTVICQLESAHESMHSEPVQIGDA